MVRLQGISKSYGPKSILKNFSLEIESGERFVLLGRSGCGKTTLLRLIAGFDAPDSGQLFIEGQNVLGLPMERRPVGFIFQRHALFPHMNVYDNIAVGPRIRGIAESDIARQIGDLLEITRLTGLENAWPNRLSGGESQRVALARAVINRPKILLLDEPLSALDPSLRHNLREELVEMQKAFGITFLFVTHDREEAMVLADRIAVLEGGHLQQTGTPEELYHRPANRFVAEFLGEVNRLEGVVESQSGRDLILGIDGLGKMSTKTDRTLRAGERVGCFIRPERLTFPESGQATRSENEFEGTVIERQFFGPRNWYRIRLNNGEIIQAQGTYPTRSFPTQTRIQVRLPAEDLMIFQSIENPSTQ